MKLTVKVIINKSTWLDHLLPAPRSTTLRSQETIVSNTQPEVWDYVELL